MDGPEIPIMDGSSIKFIDALEKAGFVDQETDREYYTIPANIHYTEPDRKVEMVAMPLDDYRFTCMIDYNSPILGSQHAAITTLGEFKKEIASSDNPKAKLTEKEKDIKVAQENGLLTHKN